MKDESLHTITIVKALLKKYGPECVDWEPVVIQKSMYDDFKAAKINVYKALAGLSLLQNDRFWNDWQTFQFLAQALNNINPSAHTIYELSVANMMVAVDTANRLRESLGGISYVPVYSEEVSKFIAAQALNQGIWFLPEPLDFASNYASKTMLVCQDCGNEEYLDDEENVCPVCTAKYDGTSLSSFSPSEERIKKGFGTNVKIVTKHTTVEAQKILQKLFTSNGDLNLDEDNPDHVCAARLYTAVKYFLKRRQEAKNEYQINNT